MNSGFYRCYYFYIIPFKLLNRFFKSGFVCFYFGFANFYNKSNVRESDLYSALPRFYFHILTTNTQSFITGLPPTPRNRRRNV